MTALDDSLVNRAAPPGSMRYFSLLYAPEDRRDALLALFVIEAEIRESAHSANHDAAHTRLQWWRAEIDRLTNAGPQHPATRLLSERARMPRSSFATLHELMAAADMDLARITYANFGELRAYSVRSGGALHELIAAELFGPEPLGEDLRARANLLGAAIRQVEILRDIRQDTHDGRLYVPLDMLDEHTARAEHFHRKDYGPEARGALRMLGDSIRCEIGLETPLLDERLRPLLVLSALHRRLLDRIASRDYDVAHERVDLGPVEKPWVAWRAARRTARG